MTQQPHQASWVVNQLVLLITLVQLGRELKQTDEPDRETINHKEGGTADA